MALSPDQRRRLLRMNMLMSYAAFASAKATTAWTPATLFAASEPGGWYDPSDLTTMFQDAAGTTAAALESPVGLVLDKSKGLVLGSELVDTANTLAPWAPQGNNTVELDDGAIKTTFVDNSNGAYLPLTAAGGLDIDPVAGRTYRFTAEMKVNVGSVTASVVSAATSPSVVVTSTSFVVVSFVFVADGSNETFRVGSMGSGEIAWVRNISVRELPGNHLSQSTSTARPVLKQDANGCYYLKFDGTDDSLSSASIDFTSTDKMSVFAGVRKLSDGARGIIVELSSVATNAGTFYFSGPDNAGVARYGCYLEPGAYYEPQTFTAPITNVVAVSFNRAATVLAQQVIPRFNGVVNQTNGSNAVTTGNFGNYPLYVGRRNNASLPFNGHLYSLIVRGAASTDAQIAATETWVNSKTRAY